jgi:hypothetical protein
MKNIERYGKALETVPGAFSRVLGRFLVIFLSLLLLSRILDRKQRIRMRQRKGEKDNCDLMLFPV